MPKSPVITLNGLNTVYKDLRDRIDALGDMYSVKGSSTLSNILSMTDLEIGDVWNISEDDLDAGLSKGDNVVCIKLPDGNNSPWTTYLMKVGGVFEVANDGTAGLVKTGTNLDTSSNTTSQSVTRGVKLTYTPDNPRESSQAYVTIPVASNTTYGVVDVNAQSFKGDKTFSDNVTVKGGLKVDGNSVFNGITSNNFESEGVTSDGTVVKGTVTANSVNTDSLDVSGKLSTKTANLNNINSPEVETNKVSVVNSSNDATLEVSNKVKSNYVETENLYSSDRISTERITTNEIQASTINTVTLNYPNGTNALAIIDNQLEVKSRATMDNLNVSQAYLKFINSNATGGNNNGSLTLSDTASISIQSGGTFTTKTLNTNTAYFNNIGTAGTTSNYGLNASNIIVRNTLDTNNLYVNSTANSSITAASVNIGSQGGAHLTHNNGLYVSGGTSNVSSVNAGGSLIVDDKGIRTTGNIYAAAFKGGKADNSLNSDNSSKLSNMSISTSSSVASTITYTDSNSKTLVGNKVEFHTGSRADATLSSSNGGISCNGTFTATKVYGAVWN